MDGCDEKGKPANGAPYENGNRCAICVLIAAGSNSGMRVGADIDEYDEEEAVVDDDRKAELGATAFVDAEGVADAAATPPPVALRNAAAAAASRGVRFDTGATGDPGASPDAGVASGCASAAEDVEDDDDASALLPPNGTVGVGCGAP